MLLLAAWVLLWMLYRNTVGVEHDKMVATSFLELPYNALKKKNPNKPQFIGVLKF